MGLTPRQAHRMSLREWFLWKRGLERQERAEWRRSLAVVNTVISIMDGDPVTMDDLEGKSTPSRRSQQEYEALIGRNSDWIPS